MFTLGFHLGGAFISLYLHAHLYATGTFHLYFVCVTAVGQRASLFFCVASRMKDEFFKLNQCHRHFGFLIVFSIALFQIADLMLHTMKCFHFTSTQSCHGSHHGPMSIYYVDLFFTHQPGRTPFASQVKMNHTSVCVPTNGEYNWVSLWKWTESNQVLMCYILLAHTR